MPSILVIGLVGPAQSAGLTRPDGNDARGPLDLASVRVEHSSKQDAIQIRALGRVSSTELDGSTGWFEIDMSTDSDRAYERWIVVFYNGSRAVGVLGHGNVSDHVLAAKRIDKRTMEVFVPYKYLGGIKGYDFAAASVWRAAPCSKTKPCVDTIPNKLPLLRSDFTAPTVTWTSKPQISTDVSDTSSYSVGFSVADDPRGVGIDRWVVQQKQGTGWIIFATGKTSTGSADIAGTPGQAITLRIKATDKQGNTTTSAPETTFVPLDDRDASLVYTTGAPVLHASVPDAYLGTTSGMAGATITATFPDEVGKTVCVIGGPSTTNVAMQVYFDGGWQMIAWEYSASTARTRWCTPNPIPSASTVVTFVVNGSDEFALDGVAFGS